MYIKVPGTEVKSFGSVNIWSALYFLYVFELIREIVAVKSVWYANNVCTYLPYERHFEMYSIHCILLHNVPQCPIFPNSRICFFTLNFKIVYGLSSLKFSSYYNIISFVLSSSRSWLEFNFEMLTRFSTNRNTSKWNGFYVNFQHTHAQHSSVYIINTQSLVTWCNAPTKWFNFFFQKSIIIICTYISYNNIL